MDGDFDRIPHHLPVLTCQIQDHLWVVTINTANFWKEDASWITDHLLILALPLPFGQDCEVTARGLVLFWSFCPPTPSAGDLIPSPVRTLSGSRPGIGLLSRALPGSKRGAVAGPIHG